MSKDDGGLISPGTRNEPAKGKRFVIPLAKDDVHHFGITRRDWLAGLAMQSLIRTNDSCESIEDMVDVETIAQLAYTYADAMIAEGKKD